MITVPRPGVNTTTEGQDLGVWLLFPHGTSPRLDLDGWLRWQSSPMHPRIWSHYVPTDGIIVKQVSRPQSER